MNTIRFHYIIGPIHLLWHTTPTQVFVSMLFINPFINPVSALPLTDPQILIWTGQLTVALSLTCNSSSFCPTRSYDYVTHHCLLIALNSDSFHSLSKPSVNLNPNLSLICTTKMHPLLFCWPVHHPSHLLTLKSFPSSLVYIESYHTWILKYYFSKTHSTTWWFSILPLIM